MALVQKLTEVVQRVDPKTGIPVPKKKVERIKHYLVLAIFNEGDEKSWEFIKGRAETFNHIIENMESYDLLESHVISETATPEIAITAYSFLRFCMENNVLPQSVMDDAEMSPEILEEFMENYYQKSEEELEAIYKKDF